MCDSLESALLATTMASRMPQGNPGVGAFPKAFVPNDLLETKPDRLRIFLAALFESALQQQLDPLIEFLKRRHAIDHHAIDEKSRRSRDLQDIGGELSIGGKLFQQGLVPDAVSSSTAA